MLLLAVSCAVLTSVAPFASAEELFDVTLLERADRTVAAELADLDGDGRVDLFVVSLKGTPPAEERTIDVYLQRSKGRLPPTPDYSLPLPRWSAVYDVADLRSDSPGEEMVVLGPSAVTLLSLADDSGRSWRFPVPGPTTTGLADDERGFEPFKMVYHEFGEEPWILVPQIGELTALSPNGEVRARLSVPRRANYFIMPSTGMISIESNFQIFLDVPKLSLGDMNGDGCTDFVSSTRHEIWTHLCQQVEAELANESAEASGEQSGEDSGEESREESAKEPAQLVDGAGARKPTTPSRFTYAREPTSQLPLNLVTPRDHIRGSGGVASEIKDIDGDGLLDLLISTVSGGFTDAETKIDVRTRPSGPRPVWLRTRSSISIATDEQNWFASNLNSVCSRSSRCCSARKSICDS